MYIFKYDKENKNFHSFPLIFKLCKTKQTKNKTKKIPQNYILSSQHKQYANCIQFKSRGKLT